MFLWLRPHLVFGRADRPVAPLPSCKWRAKLSKAAEPAGDLRILEIATRTSWHPRRRGKAAAGQRHCDGRVGLVLERGQGRGSRRLPSKRRAAERSPEPAFRLDARRWRGHHLGIERRDHHACAGGALFTAAHCPGIASPSCMLDQWCLAWSAMLRLRGSCVAAMPMMLSRTVSDAYRLARERAIIHVACTIVTQACSLMDATCLVCEPVVTVDASAHSVCVSRW